MPKPRGSAATTAERDGLSLLDGAGAFATLLYVGADAERRLDAVRALLTGRSGASLVGERLTVRALAAVGACARAASSGQLSQLSAGSLPRLWHHLGTRA